MKTKAYFVICDQLSDDRELRQLLLKRDFVVEDIAIGSDHGAIAGILKDNEPGFIFIPPAWEDMFCVKVLNEIDLLGFPFETVIFGPKPEMAKLILAFNSGLSGFVELPVNTSSFTQVINRLKFRFVGKLEADRQNRRLTEFERGGTPAAFSSQMLERDHFLARAFMDLAARSGPIFSDNVSVLLVSSSLVQQQTFEAFLKKLGITVFLAGSVAEAGRILGKGNGCRMVISDSVLPDGDVGSLVENVRKTFTSKLPRFVVITSSPDKASELLSPDMHIDDVILKPGPDAGLESILPTIIAGIYQTHGI
jgi:CheY-like chemotaxis protein